MSNPPAAADFLNVHQAAEALGISPRAVRHRIEAGTLHAHKNGEGRTSSYVITRAEIDRVKSAATLEAAS